MTPEPIQPPVRTRYYRKVIRICAEDSPNVRFAMAQLAAGIVPTEEIILPGVLPYHDYAKRRETWDAIRQCIGLDARFYEGSEVLLFPPLWLDLAESAARYKSREGRQGVAMGVDTAEGGDKTAMAVVDEEGILELVSKKTPDTNIIPGEVLAMMAKWGVPAEAVWFDRGGGGKPHADRMRASGYNVNTVSFGESVTPPPKSGMKSTRQRMNIIEERQVCLNRRAQMYLLLSLLLDPGRLLAPMLAAEVNSEDHEYGRKEAWNPPPAFGIPAEYVELRKQLSPIPKLYDSSERLYLPPKNKKKGQNVVTLVDMIGHSPDEADATVLAVFGMLGGGGGVRTTAGPV